MSAQRKAPLSPPILTVVPANSDGLTIESLAGRIQRLQAEARGLAREQIAALEAKLTEAAALAEEIALGGEAYPVGVREIARRLAEETPRAAQNMAVIMTRV